MSDGTEKEFQEFVEVENDQQMPQNVDENEQTETPDEQSLPTPKPPTHISHFSNTKTHPAWLRFGIPIYLLATLGLLLASDIGSGVAGEYLLIQPNGEIFEQEVLLQASIFTSVKELWDSGSYALAILIVFTSIMWPYVKLLLSLFAWIAPYRNSRRRERLLEVVDCLGKWSFVDIFVLLLIMVSFRATIQLNAGVTMEVVIVPRWGFFGFVLATILSLVGTHVILYQHRTLTYSDASVASNPAEDLEEAQEEPLPSDEKESLTSASNTNKYLLCGLLVTTLGLIVASCVVYIFQVTKQQGEEVESTFYSVLSVGAGVPPASLEPNSVGIRFIQAMYYVLGFALPLLNIVLFGILYMFPMTARRHKHGFMAAEICFSWSSIEVLLVSCIFSVIQIPKFGNGLINSGCTYCYTVSSALLPELSVLAIAAAMSIGVNLCLYRKAHKTLYPSLSAS
jgi:hypothetical protein